MKNQKNKKFEALVELINDLNKEGVIKKTFVGTSPEDVMRRYSNKYIFIKEPEEIENNVNVSKGGKINSKDLLWIFEGLSSFKGLSMEKLIDILYKKAKKGSVKTLLSQMKAKIREGGRISNVLSSKQYSKIIPGYMIELIKIGESSAKEDETYKILVEKLRMQQKIRSKTIGAMIYPAFVIVFAVGLVIVLLMFLVPKFTEIFKGKEHLLPSLTKSVINSSVWLQNNIVFFFISIIVFIISFIFLYKTFDSFRRFIIKILMKIPVIGWVIKTNTEILILQLFYFGEFAVSNSSGNFNYVRLMQMIYEGISNPIYKDQFAIMPSEIQKGKKIGDSLEKNVNVLSYDVISYIQFGEESNSLAEKVEYVYKKYTNDLLNFYEGISKVIEPLLIVFLGGVIGYIVGGIMLGVMNLANTIGR